MSTRCLSRLTWAVLALASVSAFGQFRQDNLVSNGFIPAGNDDQLLVNPWGLAFGPTGPFWTANYGTGTSTIYDKEGNNLPIAGFMSVAVPAVQHTDRVSNPTGIVFNGGNGFVVKGNGPVNGSRLAGPARFIFATEEGTISGWSPVANPGSAIIAVDRSNAEDGVTNDVYKGLAIAQWNGKSFIYATNFRNGSVEVFDEKFRMTGRFTDPNLPVGYRPYGIQFDGQFLVVTFTHISAGQPNAARPSGYVSLFHPNGNYIKRLVSQGKLNQPWGVALVKKQWGPFKNALLIGNAGDGKINAYHWRSGHFMGTLMSDDGRPVVIDGLRALAFGNGVTSDANKLYFTAGPNRGEDGLLGSLSFVQAP